MIRIVAVNFASSDHYFVTRVTTSSSINLCVAPTF